MRASGHNNPTDRDMSLASHLDELRHRIIRAIYGIALAAIVTFTWTWEIIAWVCAPLAQAQRNTDQPLQTYTKTVLGGFGAYMKVGLIAAVVLASPWVLYQLWKFVSAGLYPSERRIVHVLAPFSGVMTLLGLAFARYIVLPLALTFLLYFSTTFPPITPSSDNVIDRLGQWTNQYSDLSFLFPSPPPTSSPPSCPAKSDPLEHPGPNTLRPEKSEPSLSPPLAIAALPTLENDPPHPTEGQAWINRQSQDLRVHFKGKTLHVPLSALSQNQAVIELPDYLDFAMMTLLAIALAFQLPVLMLALGWSQLVNPKWIGPYRKHIFLACFVLSAVLTPTGDPFNMTLLAVPLYGLFEFGLLLMKLTYRQKNAESHR